MVNKSSVVITSNDTNIGSVVVAGNNTTIVKKVQVGKPVRRVIQAQNNINNLQGIDTSAKVNGSVLVYNASAELWTATLDLENQNINGGSY